MGPEKEAVAQSCEDMWAQSGEGRPGPRGVGARDMARERGLARLALLAMIHLAAYAAALPFDETHRYLGGVAYLVPPAVALALTPGAIRRSQGRERWAWVSIGAMLLAWTAAECVYSYYSLALRTEAPFPSMADGLYHVGYLAFLAGVALLVFSDRPALDRRLWVDTGTIILVVGVLWWHYLVAPGQAAGDGALALGAALSYPLLDLALLFALVLAFYGVGAQVTRPAVLLVVSILALLATDGAYSLAAAGTVPAASPLDLGWAVSYWLVAAALWCAPGGAGRRKTMAVVQTNAGLVLPYAVVLPLAGLAIASAVRGHTAPDLAVAACGAVGLLLARQWMTLRENRTLYRALAAHAEELERLRAEAVYASEHDALTGLLNRRAWRTRAAEMYPASVVIFDIDLFKRINDTLGHPAGDEVLREVGWRLGGTLGNFGPVGRLGGEEFAAALPGVPLDAETLCRSALFMFSNYPVQIEDGTALAVTLSAGLAWCDEQAESQDAAIEDAYRRADAALYRAKQNGRGRLELGEGGGIPAVGERAA